MKVTAYMATLYGREATLLDSVRSLAGQVDALHIWVNDYPKSKRKAMDEMLSEFTNVTVTHSDVFAEGEAGNIGDIGKFWHMDSWDGYVLTVDDTWIYPPDYMVKMIDCVERYNRKAIVTAHGRLITDKIKTYYFYKSSHLYLYNDVPKDTACNEFGTGVMALHSDVLKGKGITLECFKHTNMTDIYFSIEAQKAGIPCVVIGHRSDWVKQNPKSAKYPRISAACAKNEQLQVDVINAFNWKLLKP